MYPFPLSEYQSRIDNIVGVLHAFDLLRHGDSTSSEEVATIARPPIFVPESMLASALLLELQGSGNQMAIVVDEYGGATGIVTVEDLLEEIVGEIEDEFDVGPRQIRQEAPNVWWIDAKTPVEQLNRELDIDLPEDQRAYESIGGFVLEQLRDIPSVGDSLRFQSATITVVAASERGIDAVRVCVDGMRD